MKVYKVKSNDHPEEIDVQSSDHSTTYRLNFRFLTCTCYDFTERRKEYSPDDPRRLCKHLVNNMQARHLPAAMVPYWPLIGFLSRQNYGFPHYAKAVQGTLLGHKCLMVIPQPRNSDPDDIWINLIVDGQNYGYNPSELRWSFGREPPKEGAMLRWIDRERDDEPDAASNVRSAMDNQALRTTTTEPSKSKARHHQPQTWLGVALIWAVVAGLAYYLLKPAKVVPSAEETPAVGSCARLLERKIAVSLDGKKHIIYAERKVWNSFMDSTRATFAEHCAVDFGPDKAGNRWVTVKDATTGQILGEYKGALYVSQ